MVVGVRLIRKANAVITQLFRFLYRLGNEFSGTTGGWGAYSWSGLLATWVANAGSVSKLSSAIRVSMPNIGATGQSGVVRTNNKITITNQTAIKAKISYSLGQVSTGDGGFQRVYIFLADVSTGDWTSSGVYDALLLALNHGTSTVSTGIDEEFTLDISGIPDGDYYVCVGYVWRYQNQASWFELSEVQKIT